MRRARELMIVARQRGDMYWTSSKVREKRPGRRAGDGVVEKEGEEEVEEEEEEEEEEEGDSPCWGDMRR